MSLNRFKKSRDQNEVEIFNTLKEFCNVQVYRLDRPLDLLVRMHDGTIFLIEVKTKKGKHTPAQKRFLDAWDGSPIFTVRNSDEACKVVQAFQTFMPEDMSEIYQSIRISVE